MKKIELDQILMIGFFLTSSRMILSVLCVVQQNHTVCMKLFQPKAMLFRRAVVAFRKQILFLSPPLLDIIYVGLNPTFIDVILVGSSRLF